MGFFSDIQEEARREARQPRYHTGQTENVAPVQNIQSKEDWKPETTQSVPAPVSEPERPTPVPDGMEPKQPAPAVAPMDDGEVMAASVKRIQTDMRTVPKVPRSLNEWVRRQMMPAYFFYDYRKGRKTTTGVCSACGQEIKLTGVKHNTKGVCPHCGRELTMKANSRIGNLCDQDTCQVIQKTAPDEVVVRIFKVYYDHGRKDEEISEAARKFIRQAPDGTLSCESYYCYFGEWRKGSWPTFMCYQYHFWGDACGYVYCGNLPRALKDTPWQYCPVETFYVSVL